MKWLGVLRLHGGFKVPQLKYMFGTLLAIFRLSLRELKVLLYTVYYTRQLHVSAATGRLQVVFKRT